MSTKELTRVWDPFADLKAMTDVFGDLLSPSRTLAEPRSWMPKVDIKETDRSYVIRAAVPGVKKEDLSIRLESGALTIAGERRSEKEEKDKTWLRRETTYGSFQRSFVIPAGIHPEEVEADLEDGVLTVTLAKPAQDKSRAVHVKVR